MNKVGQLSRAGVLAAAFAALAGGVQAQANPVEAPVTMAAATAAAVPATAATAGNYRVDAARHIYDSYSFLVHRGQLPPLLRGVAIMETTIDEKGAVEKVEVVREPAVKEATRWIVAMIQGAAPYPVSTQGKVVYRDIWLITSEGKFQLDAITEGQLHKAP